MTAIRKTIPTEPLEVPAGMDWISPDVLDSKLKSLGWTWGDLGRACTPRLSENALREFRRRGGLLKRSTVARIARALVVREEELGRLAQVRDELRRRAE